MHLRAILENIGVMVIPDQIAVSSAHEAFDEEGALTNSYYAKETRSVAMQLVELAGWLKSRGV